jgi:hypothetical protein
MSQPCAGTANANTYVSKSVPSVEDIYTYCRSRKNSVNAETFYDHYQANGWKVGKVPMKDWRAAVRYWEKSTYSPSHDSSQPQLALSSKFRACGKNGCIDGWVPVTNGAAGSIQGIPVENRKLKRCQCFEDYKRRQKASA